METLRSSVHDKEKTLLKNQINHPFLEDYDFFEDVLICLNTII